MAAAKIAVIGAAAAACAGCASLVGGTPTATATASNGGGARDFQASYEIPWQLTPASTASEAQGERTTVVERPDLGKVRGTRVALAYLDREPVAYPGPTTAVAACRKGLEPQASVRGAYRIEAEAAGPVRRVGDRLREQQVFFRIFYRHPDENVVEVRQAALRCTIGADRRLIAAKPV